MICRETIPSRPTLRFICSRYRVFYSKMHFYSTPSAVRHTKEETGMTAERIVFNRTDFFEPSNTLMCNFTVYVQDEAESKCESR